MTSRPSNAPVAAHRNACTISSTIVLTMSAVRLPPFFGPWQLYWASASCIAGSSIGIKRLWTPDNMGAENQAGAKP